jgi:hypothetical protein
MRKIIDVRWFNGVGIVRVESPYDGIKYYIGTFDAHNAYDEKKDAEHVADWGLTFPKDAGDVLFGMK